MKRIDEAWSQRLEQKRSSKNPIKTEKKVNQIQKSGEKIDTPKRGMRKKAPDQS